MSWMPHSPKSVSRPDPPPPWAAWSRAQPPTRLPRFNFSNTRKPALSSEHPLKSGLLSSRPLNSSAGAGLGLGSSLSVLLFVEFCQPEEQSSRQNSQSLSATGHTAAGFTVNCAVETASDCRGVKAEDAVFLTYSVGVKPEAKPKDKNVPYVLEIKHPTSPDSSMSRKTQNGTEGALFIEQWWK